MFLHLPADGWPRIVDAYPSDKRISDELGGAVPVRAAITPNLGIMFREDARQLPLNITASYLCSRLGEVVVPILGPAVIVGLDAQELRFNSVRAQLSGEVVSLSRDIVEGLGVAARTALYAKRGEIDKLPTSTYDPDGTKLATMLGMLFDVFQIAADQLPQEWPSPALERGDPTDDSGATPTDNPHFVI